MSSEDPRLENPVQSHTEPNNGEPHENLNPISQPDKSKENQEAEKGEKLCESAQVPDDTQQNIQKMKLIFEQISKQQSQLKFTSKPKPKNKTELNKKKSSQKEEPPQKTQKQLKFEEEVSAYVEKYRKSLPIDLTESENHRFRMEEKLKLFRSLIVGVLEIQERPEQGAVEQQKLIKGSNGIELYGLARNVCNKVDDSIFRVLFSRERVKKFRNFYKQFNINLADQQNFDLRAKILTNRIRISEIPTMNQKEFFSHAKMKRYKEREAMLLNQAESIKKQYKPIEEEPNISYSIDSWKPTQKIQESQSLHYNKNTLTVLSDYLKGQHADNLKRNLEILDDQKHKNQKEFLTERLLDTFKAEKDNNEKNG